MTRLSDIEKLARDIAWMKMPGRPKMTKAAWWRSVDGLRRHFYVKDANDFLSIVKKLKPIRILTMVDFE